MTERTVQSHYSVLDLPAEATHTEIVRSYHAAVRHCHPDFLKQRNPESMSWAADQFKRLMHAYDVLTNQERRRRYNQELDGVNQPIQYSSAYGFDYADNDLPRHVGHYPPEYDEAWRDFISRPYDWTERDLVAFNFWDVIRLVTFFASVATLVWVIVGPSSEEVTRFLLTTRSMPTMQSGIPVVVATIAISAAIISVFVLTIRVCRTYPYSILHSVKFKRFTVVQLVSILFVLVYVGAFGGLLAGHFLF